jgi:hypothetical protein
VIAANASASVDAATTLAQAGPWGAAFIVVGSVALRVFYVVWKRERDRADRADDAYAALVRELLDKVVPAIVESTRAVRDYVDHERFRGPDRG